MREIPKAIAAILKAGRWPAPHDVRPGPDELPGILDRIMGFDGPSVIQIFHLKTPFTPPGWMSRWVFQKDREQDVRANFTLSHRERETLHRLLDDRAAKIDLAAYREAIANLMVAESDLEAIIDRVFGPPLRIVGVCDPRVLCLHGMMHAAALLAVAKKKNLTDLEAHLTALLDYFPDLFVSGLRESESDEVRTWNVICP